METDPVASKSQKLISVIGPAVTGEKFNKKDSTAKQVWVKFSMRTKICSKIPVMG
ncbi:MAG: Uncharacterised protein [Flavobacteriaceae bacterium]|nr:MAG: Uncharacterised protein [Flavobacteriaceae bacterium]